MTKEQKALKRLAEAYIELGISLTESEFYALKNSKYKNLLREEEYKSSFEKITESWSDENEEDGYVHKRNYPLGHSHRFNVNIYRELVQDLIDEIDEHFGIGIENEDPDKKENVQLHELKEFIKYYILKHESKHMQTFDKIRQAMNSSKSVTDLISYLNSFLI
jgi:hypothetical protein